MSRTAVNQVRIIGGRWRRRKLEFPPIEGLRPTPDRIRETLFNWLQADIDGARVLDAYCGSGVLGLESLSRGAAYACFVDSSRRVQTSLHEHFKTLGTDQAEAYCTDFDAWLKSSQQDPFDVAFLDPPYSGDYLEHSADALCSSGLLKSGSLLYIEHPSDSEPLLPTQLQPLKALSAGNNAYRLLRLS